MRSLLTTERKLNYCTENCSSVIITYHTYFKQTIDYLPRATQRRKVHFLTFKNRRNTIIHTHKIITYKNQKPNSITSYLQRVAAAAAAVRRHDRAASVSAGGPRPPGRRRWWTTDCSACSASPPRGCRSALEPALESEPGPESRLEPELEPEQLSE